MEEKERYVIRYDLDYNQCLIDTEENQGVGDYIKIVKLLNQQDKQIKELEEELDDAKRDYIPKLEFGLQRANKMCRDAEEENQQLKQQLAITEKALELACEEIGIIEAKFDSAYIRANGYLLDYFKTQAKEMLENE